MKTFEDYKKSIEETESDKIFTVINLEPNDKKEIKGWKNFSIDDKKETINELRRLGENYRKFYIDYEKNSQREAYQFPTCREFLLQSESLQEISGMLKKMAFSFFLCEMKIKKNYVLHDGHILKKGDVAMLLDSQCIEQLPVEVKDRFKSMINDENSVIYHMENLLIVPNDWLRLKKK